jgi:hypothetical protein
MAIDSNRTSEHPLMVRVPRSLVERIDDLRGLIPRETYIRDLLERAAEREELAGGAEKPASHPAVGARYFRQDGTEIREPRNLKDLAQRIAGAVDSGEVRRVGAGAGQDLRDTWSGLLSGGVRRDLFQLIDRTDLIHRRGTGS